MTKTIVIGDIHGCYEELVSLLEKAHFADDDRVVAVGDLIVKGRRNREVLDLFSSDARFSSVIGNHDLAILSFWRCQPSTLKKSQEKARVELEPAREKYFAYLASLPFMIDLGDYVVVHAGVRPGIDLWDQIPADLTELRSLGADRTSRDGTPWFDVYDGEKTILFGHWPSPEPRRAKRAIGLDTGCVYGNCLTGYILETREFIQVPAREVYDQPRLHFITPSQ